MKKSECVTTDYVDWLAFSTSAPNVDDVVGVDDVNGVEVEVVDVVADVTDFDLICNSAVRSVGPDRIRLSLR
jgi:hypothetical protein